MFDSEHPRLDEYLPLDEEIVLPKYDNATTDGGCYGGVAGDTGAGAFKWGAVDSW